MSFSNGSSQTKDQTQVSHIAGGFFTSWATREIHGGGKGLQISQKQFKVIRIPVKKRQTKHTAVPGNSELSFEIWSISPEKMMAREFLGKE